jgi:hypothetical protein
MNIHITENIDQIIDGYEIIPILYGKIDMGTVPSNSATNIVAVDALDSIPYNLLSEFLGQIKQKIRIGGKLVVGGLELSIISRDIVNGKLDSKTFNEIVFNKRGLYNVNDIRDILQSYGLKIDNVTIKGHNYEISASRPQITN